MISKAMHELRSDFSLLKAEVTSIRDARKRREALEHLRRIVELVDIDPKEAR